MIQKIHIENRDQNQTHPHHSFSQGKRSKNTIIPFSLVRKEKSRKVKKS